MRSLAPTVTLLLLCLLSACNTIKGVGLYRQKAGKKIDDAARKK